MSGKVEHDEPWQEFAANGQPKNVAWPKREYVKSDKICDSSHILVWRRSAKDVEVLLQLRDEKKKAWPSHWGISAVGHIDAGETILEAAIREAKEEINLQVDATQLEYIFSDRNVSVSRSNDEFRHVFLYEMTENQDLKFNDGEVTAIKWVALSELKNWVKNPEEFPDKIMPHAPYYFTQLFDWLEKLNERKSK